MMAKTKSSHARTHKMKKSFSNIGTANAGRAAPIERQRVRRGRVSIDNHVEKASRRRLRQGQGDRVRTSPGRAHAKCAGDRAACARNERAVGYPQIGIARLGHHLNGEAGARRIRRIRGGRLEKVRVEPAGGEGRHTRNRLKAWSKVKAQSCQCECEEQAKRGRRRPQKLRPRRRRCARHVPVENRKGE